MEDFNMAVIKESETVVAQNLEKVYAKIENFFRTRTDTIMGSRELLENEGFFIINFKKSIVSNGEELTINLVKQSEEETQIKMVSKSIVEKTKGDWGKNERNMKLVLQQLGESKLP